MREEAGRKQEYAARILLVEPEAAAAASRKTALEDCGYEVIPASSSAEALTAAHAPSRLDLILMDLCLGPELGSHLATGFPRGSDIPLIFLSDIGEHQHAARSEGMTSYGFFVKDAGIDLLDASIRMALRLHALNSKKSADTVKTVLAEKELLLKEVHHRIKNNMHTLNSLLSMQIQTLTDSLAISALKDAGSRLHSMTVLYDKLYQSPKYTTIDIDAYLPSLVRDIVSNFPNGKSIRIETRIERIALDSKLMQPLGIVINELLTNSMKYAFEGRAEGLIRVTAQQRGVRVFITVEDNGNCIPASIDFDKSGGFGLLLVKTLTRQLEGAMRIERGGGTRIFLEFDQIS